MRSVRGATGVWSRNTPCSPRCQRRSTTPCSTCCASLLLRRWDAEVVAHDAANRDVPAVRAVQQAILDAYVLDSAKHAPAREVARIIAVWESLPRHLAREIIFSAIQRSARARVIVWLEGAGLILRAFGGETARLPLRGYADRRSFKVYALDVGLLGALAGTAPQLLLHGDRLFAEYRGALVENYVAQQLAAADARVLNIPLYALPAGLRFIGNRG